uniref:Uncharacterized protein n=1 Tax=Oryza brachyantha TaxID=4533 RepID=J3MMK6_ORYBR
MAAAREEEWEVSSRRAEPRREGGGAEAPPEGDDLLEEEEVEVEGQFGNFPPASPSRSRRRVNIRRTWTPGGGRAAEAESVSSRGCAEPQPDWPPEMARRRGPTGEGVRVGGTPRTVSPRRGVAEARVRAGCAAAGGVGGLPD